MSSAKNEISIHWSPFHDNEFILAGNSILFYSIFGYDSTRTRIENNLFLSDNTCAKLIASINNYPKPKSIAWYPGYNFGTYTIALHEANSSLVQILCPSFNYDTSDRLNNVSIGLEINESRSSYQIEWNPRQCQYLGVGLDKVNETSSLLIWDAFHSTKPVYKLDEFGACYSIAWHPETPELIFSYSDQNSLSIFDLKSGNRPIKTITTELGFGFCIDKMNSIQAASYGNNKIAIWDLRKFTEAKNAIGIIEEPKQVKKIQFCPSKADRLAVLTESSNQVNVYRFEKINDQLYKDSIHNMKPVKNSNQLNTFSWHSTDHNQLMVCFNSFNSFVLMDLNITDFCPIGFSMNDKLSIALNDQIVNVSLFGDEKDIGEKMKTRALNMYGVQNFLDNIKLVSDDKSEEDLKYLWNWFHLANVSFDKSRKDIEKYDGIKSILTKYKELNSFEPIPKNLCMNNFDRNYLTKMCEWDKWSELVERLKEHGEYERAACICVFNDDLQRAIEILISNKNSSYFDEYLALSLALNCLKNKSGIDHQSTHKILNKLNSPYLKILFFFLNDPKSFDIQLLNDQNVQISDRICMACKILRLEELISYVNRLTNECCKAGSLYGILLTGLGPDCIELFQNYIHRTSDVQTAAVAIIHAPLKNLSSKYVNANGWIESYRELLDSWMLWEQRALYDIHLAKPVEPKIYIRCCLCGENISTKEEHKRKMRSATEKGANSGMLCQACQKPSLKCSVCSFYMAIDPPRSGFYGNKDKMSYWFVFCQKCSHGGHLGHLNDWFISNKNSECPIMNCNCQCSISDCVFNE